MSHRYTLSRKQLKELDRDTGLLLAIPVDPDCDLRGNWWEVDSPCDRWLCERLPEAADAATRSISRDPRSVWVQARRTREVGSTALVDLVGNIVDPDRINSDGHIVMRVGVVVVYIADLPGGVMRDARRPTHRLAWPNGPIRGWEWTPTPDQQAQLEQARRETEAKREEILARGRIEKARRHPSE